MRKRGRYVDFGGDRRGTSAVGHSTSGAPVGHTPEATYKHSEVPEEWRKHAHEPWRVLFPDLVWSPPPKDG
jgi:hypothetical protein